jgi:hemerythrin-like domain-containing protein
MKSTIKNFENKSPGRRTFVKQGLIITLSGMTGVNLLAAGKPIEVEDDEGQKVSPPEDLMQEHGLLNRILLIYDTCKTHLVHNTSFPIESLAHAAGIIRTFVEDYHEKQEENYLFPRFKKAGKLIDLVDTLLQQHNAGRKLTDQIKQLSAKQNTDKQKLIEALTSFNRMYRPHEAREDTVLFPAFRKLVSTNEYDSLGEQFEKNEHKLFGQDGFEKMVDKVADIEKTLGIYELSQFTPKV